MSVSDIEALFEKVGVLRWGDLVGQGLSGHHIAKAIDAGVIRRPVMRRSLGPVPGILVSAEANGDGMRDAAIAMVLTHGEGVVHGRTAAKFLRLADTLPPELDLLVPHRMSRLPRQTTFEARRCRNPDLLTVEVDDVETDIGVPIRMTSPVRTVADLLHSGRRNSEDYRFGVTALSRFLGGGGETGAMLRVLGRLYPESQGYAAALANSAHEMMASNTRDGDDPDDRDDMETGMRP
jgi:hypothetical protein